MDATVDRVYDGDTLYIAAELRLEAGEPRLSVLLDSSVGVRVEGIDTPELRGQCERERLLARRARDYVQALVAAAGGVVRLSGVKLGKYAGRVVARVSVGGRDLAEALVAAGHARVYEGRRLPWC